MEKPTIPKGTRDFGPAIMAKREYILENIKKVFQKYGFQPLETPAMENLSTLTGKYGDEGDQLLFRILDWGDFFEKFKQNLDSKSQVRIINTKDFLFEELLKFTNQFINSGISSNQKDDYRIIHKALSEYFSSNDFNSSTDIARPEEKNLIQFFIKENLNVLANSLGLLYLKTGLWAHDSKKGINLDIDTQFKLTRASFNEWILPVLNLNDALLKLTTTTELRTATSEKGLRYDLTVPFARYVVMNRGEITFPFKRYQIQPVWRADRPQKGRYREFYQCDADVVGTDSLICEAEIILMIKESFQELNITNYTIKINHRGVLAGLAELSGSTKNQTSLFVVIDKLDKMGEQKVREELKSKGFEETSLNTVFEILNFAGTTQQKVDFLTSKFVTAANGQKGISDFTEVLSLLRSYGVNEEHVEFDITLARGLSYYTGCIFEVKMNNVSIGSVGGGGRYDNLTGNFGLPGVSGVGFSFGVDRLYDAMEELHLFPEGAQISTTVMIAHIDDESLRYGLKVAYELRQNGIATEVYPELTKLKKQMDYANKKIIPFVIVIGSDEMKDGLLTIKNMQTGEQEKLSLTDIKAKKLAPGNKQ